MASGHRLRFSELKAGIEGITQRMLTLTVRNLERDGLLTRHYFPKYHHASNTNDRDGRQHVAQHSRGSRPGSGRTGPRIEVSRQTYDEGQR